MARRQAVTADDVFRRAAIAHCRQVARSFASEAGRENLATLEAGEAFVVSSSRLFLGLLLLGERELAKMFCYPATSREHLFVLEVDNTLRELERETKVQVST